MESSVNPSPFAPFVRMSHCVSGLMSDSTKGWKECERGQWMDISQNYSLASEFRNAGKTHTDMDQP